MLLFRVRIYIFGIPYNNALHLISNGQNPLNLCELQETRDLPYIYSLDGLDDFVLHADSVDEPLSRRAEYHRFLGPPIARVRVHERGAPN